MEEWPWNTPKKPETISSSFSQWLADTQETHWLNTEDEKVPQPVGQLTEINEIVFYTPTNSERREDALSVPADGHS